MDDARNEPLNIWTIFESPVDAPGQFVVRRFEIIAGGTSPTSEAYVSPDLGALRLLMRQRGLYRIPRNETDEAHIIESWL